MESKSFQLQIKVLNSNLQQANSVFSKKMNCYVVVSFVDDGVGVQEKRTVVDNNGDNNPMWNSTFEFLVSNLNSYPYLIFEVFSHREFLPDKRVGKVTILVSELMSNVKDTEITYKTSREITSLTGKKMGILFISYGFVENKNDTEIEKTELNPNVNTETKAPLKNRRKKKKKKAELNTYVNTEADKEFLQAYFFEATQEEQTVHRKHEPVENAGTDADFLQGYLFEATQEEQTIGNNGKGKVLHRKHEPVANAGKDADFLQAYFFETIQEQTDSDNEGEVVHRNHEPNTSMTSHHQPSHHNHDTSMTSHYQPSHNSHDTSMTSHHQPSHHSHDTITTSHHQPSHHSHGTSTTSHYQPSHHHVHTSYSYDTSTTSNSYNSGSNDSGAWSAFSIW